MICAEISEPPSIVTQFADLMQAAAQPSALLSPEYLMAHRAGFARLYGKPGSLAGKAMSVVQADENKFEEQASRERLFTNP